MTVRKASISSIGLPSSFYRNSREYMTPPMDCLASFTRSTPRCAPGCPSHDGAARLDMLQTGPWPLCRIAEECIRAAPIVSHASSLTCGAGMTRRGACRMNVADLKNMDLQNIDADAPIFDPQAF